MIKLLRFLRNVASPSRDRRYFAAKLFGEMVTGDYRTSWRQLDWWEDSAFSAYLKRFGELDGFNTQRRWTLWQLIRLTGHVPGDTAECGVYQGGSSWLICSFTEQTSPGAKLHHLFDSFEGLSAPEAEDGAHWKQGDLSASEQLVADNLAPFKDKLRFYKGWIPDRFAEAADVRFSFVHVDVDLRQPTRDSLEFFYDRLNPGAVFLCDDYACSNCPGATKAIDDYLASRPEKMIALDSGGGFFIKGLPVGPPLQPGPGIDRRDG